MNEFIDEEEEYDQTFKLSWTSKYNFELLDKDQHETEDFQTLQNEKVLKKQLTKSNPTSDRVIRKGMIRYVYLVLDYSKHMLKKEFCMGSQIRHALVLKTLKVFLKEFFDKNPLCQIGIVCTRNEKAEIVANLNGNFFDVLEQFEKYFQKMPSGEPSLENSLKVVDNFMTNVPNYGSKEVVIIYSGIGTVDPGDINKMIERIRKKKVSCTVFGFGAKIFILEKLAKETLGKYVVPTNEIEFSSSIMSISKPPALLKELDHVKQCIPMGFPTQKLGVPTPCYCHKKLKKDGFYCPRCGVKYCSIPVDCKVCGLVLVSSFHISRSFHHLFPVKNFEELKEEEYNKGNKYCYGCQKEMHEERAIRCLCTNCKNAFCIECDVFIHENLHICPGCSI